MLEILPFGKDFFLVQLLVHVVCTVLVSVCWL